MRLYTLAILFVISVSTSTDAINFMAEKLKSTINNLFHQSSFSVVNIPFYPDSHLERLFIYDFTYQHAKTHQLTLKTSVEGSIIGTPIDTSIIVRLQFEIGEDSITPVKLNLKMDKGNNALAERALEQANRSIARFLGKPLSFDVLWNYIVVQKNEAKEGYRFNFDVSKYMQRHMKAMAGQWLNGDGDDADTEEL